MQQAQPLNSILVNTLSDKHTEILESQKSLIEFVSDESTITTTENIPKDILKK